jgi:hypothetical protein
VTRYRLIVETKLELEQADYQLRRALKCLLRSFGFRCTHVALHQDEAK